MKEKLYTTAEIMLATGLQRGTVTNRAYMLGFERNGQGYTAQQVLQIVTMPVTRKLQRRRKSMEMAVELRGRLNDMMTENDIPMAIVQNRKGEWQMEMVKGW